MQQYSGKEVPLVPGGLRGYREWAFGPSGLKAVNFGYRWGPGINVADCRARPWDPNDSPGHPTPAPDAGCTCGLYAKYEPQWLLPRGCTPGAAVGVIEASGRVILGTHGFRAEKARIVALCVEDDIYMHPPWDPGIQVFDRIPDMLAAFPLQDVSELIGPQEPASVPLLSLMLVPGQFETTTFPGLSWLQHPDPTVRVYVNGGPVLYEGPRSGIKEIRYEDGEPRVILNE